MGLSIRLLSAFDRLPLCYFLPYHIIKRRKCNGGCLKIQLKLKKRTQFKKTACRDNDTSCKMEERKLKNRTTGEDDF